MSVTVVTMVASYLIGSVSGSLLVGRIRGVDIRSQGSGNAGGTNAFRTQGALFALAVVLIDIGKGAIAAGLLPFTVVQTMLAAPGISFLSFSLLCGFAAILGHVYPVYHRFRGGKGAGTFVGVLAVTQPLVIAPVVGVWLLVLVTTGYVSLATILSAASLLPLAYYFAEAGSESTWIVFAVSGAALIVFTHRSNIQRLWSGSEYCFTRAKLFSR